LATEPLMKVLSRRRFIRTVFCSNEVVWFFQRYPRYVRLGCLVKL